ncbi:MULTISPECIES: tripartite tricarboxylate transporter substrate binding protein [unclassified Polynucleobacter]|uniref:tripartite tricarboxylate transporter substrate binding protein n=1 Tax=unclassified Polynucleobacter TaxID=2640945 RepID=UPI001BFD6C71|nr:MULTISPECIES: tripartite tricarboxylate transporter substrate binding protein [unclassified Polynucleobacter]MBU3547494.1 tripartite tricarboxylate transporter substrate binding protein [Polynucleobacter sp. P1-05-14]QWD81586.1 tripartite tricarboxylate transporter substrate binding protein [Polynucleobacter sp. MWH-S4W17]
MKSFVKTLLVALLATTGLSHAQEWPSRPISLIVSYPPGGTADLMARTVATPLGKLLGTSVVVENKPGASGQIAASYVAKANADGYTLMLDASSYSVNPSLFPKLPYDPNKDFKTLAVLAQYPNVLLVNPSFPAKSVKELVAMAKAKPNSISYASSGNGSAQHLAGALFEVKAGVEMQHVPYKGGGPALNDVIGGQVPVFFGSVASTKQYVDSGKLNALAVTGKKRASSMPSVPTMAEAGVPGYEVYEWNGIFAPAATPAPILIKLSDAIAKVMQSPEVREKVLSLGGEPFQGNSDAADKFIKAQMAEWAKLVKSGKIAVD